MLVEEAINTIICKEGVGILEFPNKVIAMIGDYSNSYQRDLQLFRLSCQNGLLNYGQKILQLNRAEDVANIAIKAKEMLQHDAFMDEVYAVKSVNMLLKGLGIANEIKMSQKEDQGLNHTLEHDIQSLENLAGRGDVRALLDLGYNYLHGIGVTEDWMIAESYYRRAFTFGGGDEKDEALNCLIEIHNNRQAGP